ncbi:MAG: mhpD [Rhodospirillales bacterium]|jgi:2-keto-4-pentenoate hydratase|nr:mhpD [Rhodospirillales bacterium]
MSENENRAERAAALLTEVGETGRPIADFPAECKPRSAAEAYDVQDAVVRRRGPIVAWKVGAASPGGETSSAPIFTLIASPASVPAAGLRMFGVEAELAFRLTRDLPPRASPYSRDEVIAAIGSAHPVIELLESRFVDRDRVDAAGKLADNLTNFALVAGPAIAAWPALDFDPARPPVELRMDGAPMTETTGNAAGDPLALVTALANDGARRHGGLRAGALVTTGSLTAMAYARPGATVVADFGRLGEVRVVFAT